VSAYEERIDAWLERVEAAFAPVPDLLEWARSAAENSAEAIRASKSNGNEIAELRREAKTFEGRLSDLEVKADVIAADVAEIKDTLKTFRDEFKSGFAELFERFLKDEPGEERAGVAVATVHPLRPPEPAE
jgi:chromosome segregation ATPase